MLASNALSAWGCSAKNSEAARGLRSPQYRCCMSPRLACTTAASDVRPVPNSALTDLLWELSRVGAFLGAPLGRVPPLRSCHSRFELGDSWAKFCRHRRKFYRSLSTLCRRRTNVDRVWLRSGQVRTKSALSWSTSHQGWPSLAEIRPSSVKVDANRAIFRRLLASGFRFS